MLLLRGGFFALGKADSDLSKSSSVICHHMTRLVYALSKALKTMVWPITIIRQVNLTLSIRLSTELSSPHCLLPCC